MSKVSPNLYINLTLFCRLETWADLTYAALGSSGQLKMNCSENEDIPTVPKKFISPPPSVFWLIKTWHSCHLQQVTIGAEFQGQIQYLALVKYFTTTEFLCPEVPFIVFWCLILPPSKELNPLIQRFNLRLVIKNSPLCLGSQGHQQRYCSSHCAHCDEHISQIFRSSTSLIERSISALLFSGLKRK